MSLTAAKPSQKSFMTCATAAQTKFISRIYNAPRTLGILQAGFGKTACTLAAIQKLFSDGHRSRVLIVAPARPAADVWPVEPGQWCDLPVVAYAGGPDVNARRRVLMDAGNKIVVINIENLAWAVDSGLLGDFDGLVIDEISKFKSVGGAAYKKLSRIKKQFTWRVGLSATPVAEGLRWLYGQVKLLDDGAALGTRQDEFLETWFFPVDFQRRKWEEKPNALPEIVDRIADLIYCDTGDYETGLPLLDLEWRVVNLPSYAVKIYSSLSRDYCWQDVVCENAGVLTGKLLQLTSGFLYSENEIYDIHRAKADAIIAGVAGDLCQGQHVVVVYQFEWELEIIREAFPDSLDVRNPSAIRLWNDGDLPVLTMHPKSGGHGLNIQSGGHCMWFFSPLWSLDLFDQTLRRLVRRGQESAIVKARVITCGFGVDVDCEERIAAKLSQQSDFNYAISRRVC